MTPAQIAALATLAFRGLLIIALIVAVLYAFGGFKHLLTAPLETQVEVGRANNQGFKEAAEHSNKGVDGLKTDAEKRQDKGRAAVKSAGKPEEAKAAAIMEKKCSWGSSDYECANGRIDRELGLK